MGVYRILKREPLTRPALVAALDGWVDAGDCGTIAAAHIAEEGEVAVTFDLDQLLDFRARRPTLEIVDGRLSGLTWPELAIRRARHGDRDLLVLVGPEPDYRWGEFRRAIVGIAAQLGVVDAVCLGAIPAMVAHTRPTPVLTTGSIEESAESDVPLPAPHMRVPGAAVNLVELALSELGIRSAGFWAQVPHYIAGTYSAGALALVQRVSAHLQVPIPTDALVEQARLERINFDQIVATRPEAQQYLARLEEMEAPPAVPSTDDIASEVERFLRETTGEARNPFEEP